jgi:hypothetical protein
VAPKALAWIREEAMKIGINKSLWMAATLAGAVTLGMSAPARASIQLRITEVGVPGATVTVTNPVNTGPVNFTGPLGDFTINVAFGSSNSPGGVIGFVQQGTNSIVNNSGATHELLIDVSAQGFTSPTSPPPVGVLDSFAATIVTGTVTGTFKGTADATNALFGTGYTNAGLNLSFTATGPANSVAANGVASTGFSPAGATYSLSSFADLNLTGGAILTGHLGNEVTFPAVPEPASLAMAFSGLGLLGGAGWMRRRSRQG